MKLPAFAATALALLALICLVRHSVGCSSLPAADDPELADLSKRLSKCRAEARAAKADGGASAASAYMKYEDCKRREHVEGAGAE